MTLFYFRVSYSTYVILFIYLFIVKRVCCSFFRPREIFDRSTETAALIAKYHCRRCRKHANQTRFSYVSVGKTKTVYHKTRNTTWTLVACTGRPARLARSSLLRQLRARTGLCRSPYLSVSHSLPSAALPVRVARSSFLVHYFIHRPSSRPCDHVKSSTDAYDVPNANDRRVIFIIFCFVFFWPTALFFTSSVVAVRRPVHRHA